MLSRLPNGRDSARASTGWVTKDELASFKEHMPVARSAKPSKPTVDEMDGITAKHLRALAIGSGATGKSRVKKAELVDAVR